ncbi:hypothetical protein DFH09DRAFT_1096713 [Mycena vulgaris]|nr:hypothetical protein DFH09DRAFT_1096713 [Mycena vulgaris]
MVNTSADQVYTLALPLIQCHELAELDLPKKLVIITKILCLISPDVGSRAAFNLFTSNKRTVVNPKAASPAWRSSTKSMVAEIYHGEETKGWMEFACIRRRTAPKQRHQPRFVLPPSHGALSTPKPCALKCGPMQARRGRGQACTVDEPDGARAKVDSPIVGANTTSSRIGKAHGSIPYLLHTFIGGDYAPRQLSANVLQI